MDSLPVFDLGLALREIADHREIRRKRDMRLGVERIASSTTLRVAREQRRRSWRWPGQPKIRSVGRFSIR
jgi:hypothetical protein